MKITEIKYRMVRAYRNGDGSQTVEAAVTLDKDDDDPQAAFEHAREHCTKALAYAHEASLQDKLRACMSNEAGRRALDGFLTNLIK